MKAIGQYEIVSLLGDGGMGSVYKARDPRFDRCVAIKLLHPHYQRDPGIVQRFRAEAVIQAKLNHPGIVRVIDFVDNGDQLAMVQEYIEGRPLSAVLDASPLGLGESLARDLATQILSALGHAHARGLVHRDIKPANVLVWEGDGQRVAKLTDFGIAKILGDDKKMTATGAKMGTLAYMSPEHIRSPKSVDARSDLYSVGVTLYEMLCGRLPYPEDTEYELMRRVLEEEAPPLPPTQPPVSASLQAVLDRALAKEPGERFQTAEEFAGALRGEAVLSAPPRRRTSNEPGPKVAAAQAASARGQRAWMAVGAVVVLAVLAVAFGMSRAATPNPAAPAREDKGARAEAEAAAARRKAEVAEAALAKLKADADAESQAQKLAQAQAAAREAEEGERRRQVVQELRAELGESATRARALLDAGQADRAREILRGAIEGVGQEAAADLAADLDGLRQLQRVAEDALLQQAAAAAATEAQARVQRDRLAAVQELFAQAKYPEAKNASEELLKDPGLSPELRAAAERTRADAVDALKRIFAGTRAGPAQTTKKVP